MLPFVKMNTFHTIADVAKGVYGESGSKFLAFAHPVSSEEEVKQLRDLLQKEHHKAVHVVWAFRIGYEDLLERSSDDGEPSGSAGKPVLNALRSAELYNTAVLVVRYYGGKKLGIPGLIHAYRAATEDALAQSGKKEVTIYEMYTVTCAMEEMQLILHQLNKLGARVIENKFEENCIFKILIPREKHATFLESIQNLWQAAFVHLGSSLGMH